MTDNKNGSMQVDAELVRQLAELLDDTHLTEIEVQDGDRRIRVVRNVAIPTHTVPAPVAVSAIAFHGSPLKPQPHVALFSHADAAKSHAPATIAANASRSGAISLFITVVSIHRHLDALDDGALDGFDRALDAGVQ